MAIYFLNKCIIIRLNTMGKNNFDTGTTYNKIGLAFYNKGNIN